MAQRIRRPPGVVEQHDPRAVEYWRQDIENALKRVGTRTIDLGSIGAGAISTFTITITGALAGEQQTVLVTPPAAIEAGLMWCGFISADDEVTVRVYNSTGAPIDPNQGTWSCRVFP